jgi:NADH-quinone oxidoreductase subunit M
VARLTDLNRREAAILAALIAAVFWLGLFPAEPLRKTETAAREFRQLVLSARADALPGSRP